MPHTLRSRIIGTGSYAPKKTLTNDDLAAMVDTSDAWISSRTGIRERRVASNDSSTDMAVKAARAALKAADVQAKDIDLVIAGTVTSEMIFPSTACFVQSELGVRAGAPAFDVAAACSGFLFALDAADRYIRTGAAKKALVIGVDKFSRIVDWKDRSTCVLFGDGAGAAVLSSSNGQRGLLASNIHCDGRRWEMLYAHGPLGPSCFEDARRPDDPYVRMKGSETFKIAVRTMETAVMEALEASGLTKGDVSLLVPHQANMRIIKAIQERMGLNDEQVVMNLDRYGNTSAGSIPLALDEAVRNGRVKDGDVVVFVAFGGGMTWASSIVKW